MSAGNPKHNTESALVGDIGGTNARLAMVEFAAAGETRIVVERIFHCADFPSLEAVLESFLEDLGKEARPPTVVAAVAGPVIDGVVSFTNLGWRVSEASLASLGFARAKLINDFTPQALAIPGLLASDVDALGGPAAGLAQSVIAVIGARTGFGAAGLVFDHGHAVPFASEGFHMSFAPSDEVEVKILRILAKCFAHVSVERVVSGPGLVNLFQALAAIRGEATDPSLIAAAEIVAAAAAGNAGAQEAVERICLIFGSVAGDFALTYGAQGGVFLAGAMAPKLIGTLERDGFRQLFEAKGRMTDYVRKIPSQVILRDDVALLGAARVAAELTG